jgi:hypothetical protein
MRLLPVHVDRRDQQVGVVGPFVVNLVVRDDLLLGRLVLQHLAELGGLGGLALADDRRVGLEQADELPGARVSPNRVRPSNRCNKALHFCRLVSDLLMSKLERTISLSLIPWSS